MSESTEKATKTFKMAACPTSVEFRFLSNLVSLDEASLPLNIPRVFVLVSALYWLKMIEFVATDNRR